ncbi:hypothetical protein R1flu_017154 [Riccia fluitans]
MSSSSSDYDTLSPRRKQEVVAAAGAALLATYQSVTVTPSVFFPRDEDEDFFCPSSVHQNESILDLDTDLTYAVELAILAAAVAKTEGNTEGPGTVTQDEEEVLEENDEVMVVEPGGSWFNSYLLDVWDDDRWMHLMKMTRRTFLHLVEHLVPGFQREPLFTEVSVEKKVGATIYRLVHATDLLELGKKFSMDSHTLEGGIAQSVRAINWRLNHLIAWPSGKDAEKVIQGFEAESGLPNCCGALDIYHIPILSEIPGYRNKQGTYSVILQAVCDSSLRFLDTGCGWFGATRPQRVLRNSTFLERVNQKEVLSGPEVRINAGFCLRQYVVGNALYPHLPWLLTPYDDDTLSYSKECFNHIHERCRKYVAETFKSFQTTFKLLAQPADHNLDFLPHLVFCACLLHNFLISVKEVGVVQTLIIRNFPDENLGVSEDGVTEESAEAMRAELTQLIVLTT